MLLIQLCHTIGVQSGPDESRLDFSLLCVSFSTSLSLSLSLSLAVSLSPFPSVKKYTFFFSVPPFTLFLVFFFPRLFIFHLHFLRQLFFSPFSRALSLGENDNNTIIGFYCVSYPGRTGLDRACTSRVHLFFKYSFLYSCFPVRGVFCPERKRTRERVRGGSFFFLRLFRC